MKTEEEIRKELATREADLADLKQAGENQEGESYLLCKSYIGALKWALEAEG